MRRWQLLVQLFRNGTNTKWPSIHLNLELHARFCLMIRRGSWERRWSSTEQHGRSSDQKHHYNTHNRTCRRCNLAASASSTCSWRNMYRLVWSLPVKTLWSYETKLKLFGINLTRRVWKKRNAVYDPKNTIPTETMEVEALWYGSCFSAKGAGRLHSTESWTRTSFPHPEH